MPPKAVVRQRRWAPKVRTGCKTCKIRKLKCDEAKPRCLRCIKDRFDCDWYTEAPKALIFNPSAKAGTLKAGSPESQTNTGSPNSNGSVAVYNVTNNSLEGNHFIVEPSIAWTAETDRNYCQFFLLQFAPLLSTTSQWQYFWHSVVPQAAWDHPAINHAMVAAAASCESRISHVDRTSLILIRTNLAIRAFTAESSSYSLDITLIVCRLFTAMAQFRDDFDTATMHMKNGHRIFQEAVRSGRKISDVSRTMAPTLLALSTEAIDDTDFYLRTSPEKWALFDILKDLRSQYWEFLQSMSPVKLMEFGTKLKGVLCITWSILTQALSSMIYPNIVIFTKDDPITPVSEIITEIEEAGDELMSLEHLRIEFTALIQDIRDFSAKNVQRKRGHSTEELIARLRRCVENYVVQAAEIEPEMTAGTFWHDYHQPYCFIDKHLTQNKVNSESSEATEILDCKSYADVPPVTGSRTKKSLDIEFDRKKRDYYLEHVCQYRSGFMPTSVDTQVRVTRRISSLYALRDCRIHS